MIDMSKDLIILSAELESATWSGNRQRTETLKGMLEDLNLDFLEARGYYNNEGEMSFVVFYNNQAEYEAIRDFGLNSFDQDSILHQEFGDTYLVFSDDYKGSQYIGELVEVNPKEIEQLENFTIVNNRIFTTKKS